MSRKRRIFDVDLPEDTHEIPPDIETKSMRRGPMASAIGEVGDARRYREKLEAEIRAENDALAQELVRLKGLGLVTDLIPIDDIRTTKLTRDRMLGQGLDLGDLKASLREIGLSNPIRLEALGNGVYELVEGLRRLTAYRELHRETGDPRWARIPAGILAAGQTDAGLYRRMVDENLIRKDVSFAEMAQLARAYASDGVDGCASSGRGGERALRKRLAAEAQLYPAVRHGDGEAREGARASGGVGAGDGAGLGRQIGGGPGVRR